MNAAVKTEAATLAQELIDTLNAQEDRNYHWGFDKGRKYVRIWHENEHPSGQTTGRAVYCFIDQEGVVWYPAGWKGPTKNHPRGDVSTPEGMAALVERGALYPFGGALTL